MNAFSILKGFVLESFIEAKKRFENYKMIYLGLLAVNILVRLPSSHFGYDRSNIFYYSSVSIILQVCISIFMTNLILIKISLDKNKTKGDLIKGSVRFIKGQVLYYLSAIIGFVFLVIPAFLALFFLCLAPVLEIIEDHKGLSSLKRSYCLVKKDMPLIFLLNILFFIFYLVLELIFSRLRDSGIGFVIYIITALFTTFTSVIATLTYVRIIDYLKNLRVLGMINPHEIPVMPDRKADSTEG